MAKKKVEQTKENRELYIKIFGVEPTEEFTDQELALVISNHEYVEKVRSEIKEKQKLESELKLKEAKEKHLLESTYLVRGVDGKPYRISKIAYDKMDGKKPELIIEEPKEVKQLKAKQNGIDQD